MTVPSAPPSNIPPYPVPVPEGLDALGVPDATTFLRGDRRWATPAGSTFPTAIWRRTSGGTQLTGNPVDLNTWLSGGSVDPTGDFWNRPSGTFYNWVGDDLQIAEPGVYAMRLAINFDCNTTTNHDVVNAAFLTPYGGSDWASPAPTSTFVFNAAVVASGTTGFAAGDSVYARVFLDGAHSEIKVTSMFLSMIQLGTV